MVLQELSLTGFKSFAGPTKIQFKTPITAIVGPNGSGKSNIADAFRFVLGESSTKSLRGERAEDIIWSGSSTTGRHNRAHAALLLSNKANHFSLPYENVLLERALHRDRTNEHKINGSVVRRKDKLKAISKANIAPSGHHIIAQGEADKFLSANPFEFASLLEDALGLRVIHIEKQEALSRMERAHEASKELEIMLATELPLLKEAERQLARIARAEKAAQELVELGRTYAAGTAQFIAAEQTRLREVIETTSSALNELRNVVVEEGAITDISSLESELEALRNKRPLLEEALRTGERKRRELENTLRDSERVVVSNALEYDLPKLLALKDASDNLLARYAREEEVRPEEVWEFISTVRSAFLDAEVAESNAQPEINREEIETLIEAITVSLSEVEKEMAHLSVQERQVFDAIREVMRENARAQSGPTELEATRRELEIARLDAERSLEALRAREQSFNAELAELSQTCGLAVLRYEDLAIDGEITESDLVNLRRTIDRKLGSIQNEDLGSAREIQKELEEKRAYVSHIEKELQDVVNAEASAREVILELERTLQIKFDEGVRAISDRFNEHFARMFGGGSAGLTIKTDENGKTGVWIDVDLPFKRVRGLASLSGGERTLVSLALLFSICLHNPPPFIVLDETDAALDEANSRRYGELLESLSEHTELILITHNRETMTRAGTIYGVTMGKDGVSRLLSISLEE